MITDNIYLFYYILKYLCYLIFYFIVYFIDLLKIFDHMHVESRIIFGSVDAF